MREDGKMQTLVCQMGGCAGKEVRQIKMSTTENLIEKYDINLAVFMELNFNCTKVNSSANLASWLQQEERETRSVMAHNTHEFDDIFSKHKPGGYRHGVLEQVSPICKEDVGGSKWPRLLVFVAILLQPQPWDQNYSRL